MIRRGDEDVRKQSYYQRIDTMQQQLSDYLSRDDAIDKTDLADAEQLLKRWRAADDRINAYIAVGNYQAATQVALGTGEDDSTPAFDKLDTALTQRHRGEPKPVAQRHPQRPAGVVGCDGRRRGAVGRRGAGGGAGVVAKAKRVPVMSVLREEQTALMSVSREEQTGR